MFVRVYRQTSELEVVYVLEVCVFKCLCKCTPACECVCRVAYTHQLCDSVDVDLALLHSSTEKHGRRHQEIVCHSVSIYIERGYHTAIVGADLQETHTHKVIF